VGSVVAEGVVVGFDKCSAAYAMICTTVGVYINHKTCQDTAM